MGVKIYPMIPCGDLSYYRKPERYHGAPIVCDWTEDDTEYTNYPPRLDAVPFVVPRKCVVDAMACSVYGLIEPHVAVRMGIYQDRDFYPSVLVAETAPLDISALGDFSASLNAILKEGLYWLACAAGGAGYGSLYTLPRRILPILGSATGRENWGYGYRVAGTDYTSGLPAEFPDGATLLTGESRPYWVSVRIAQYL